MFAPCIELLNIDTVKAVSPTLVQVSDAIDLSKRTIRKIQQNLCWAFGYNIIAIPLAAGALLPSLGICLTPSISGALMGFSSLMVVSNSLLLQLEVQHHWNSMAALDPAPSAQAAAYTSGSRKVPAVNDTQQPASSDAAGWVTDKSQSQDKGQAPRLNLRKGGEAQAGGAAPGFGSVGGAAGAAGAA